MMKFNHTFADLNKFDKYFVGSDKFLARLQESVEHIANTAATAYPPFNLKKVEDNKYVIELAVAGFSKQDLELTLEDNKLLIKGSTTLDTVTEDGEGNISFLHKGISDRPFTRSFTLADNVVINNAQMINGLLKIWLEHIIPEEKKPKKIDITEADETAAPKLKKSAKADKYIPE